MMNTQSTFKAMILCVTVSTAASAAPVIDNAAGEFDHGATLIISGSSFGSKPQAAPVIWDDASGTDIRNLWDNVWPDAAPTPEAEPHYTAPVNGISLPHNHITRYIMGSHAGGDSRSGYQVFLIKSRNVSSYPYYSYISWYQRFDDAWQFCGDNNLKAFATSNSPVGPYSSEYYYLEYNSRPTSTSSSAGWTINLLPAGIQWGPGAVNPMSGIWSRIEVEIKYTNQSDGYFRLWENGEQKFNFTGQTASGSASVRTEGVGGYSRCYNRPSNRRYFADVYMDYTRARTVLANDPNLSNATIIENQIPSSWSDGKRANSNRGNW